MIPKLNEWKEKYGIQSREVIDLGIDRVKKVLQALGNPEQQLAIIHVGGTNGKGSTIAFMQALLNEQGRTTGIFTSPAVQDVFDQIRRDGVLLTAAEMDQRFQQLAGIDGIEELTDFELLTVIALLQFIEWQVDVVLLEVGLGGKDDSTNVVSPKVSVITSVSLDHTAVLGATVEEIATVKGGIIKPLTPVVVGEENKAVQSVLKKIAAECQSPIYCLSESFQKLDEQLFVTGLLVGPHQLTNATVAVQAVELLTGPIHEQFIQRALTVAYLPNRFEQIKQNMWVDGAHNPAAARALVDTIQDKWGKDAKVDFYIGILKRKDVQSVLDELREVAASITFVAFDHPEALTIEDARANGWTEPFLPVDQIFNCANSTARPTIITGSLYLLQALSQA